MYYYIYMDEKLLFLTFLVIFLLLFPLHSYYKLNQIENFTYQRCPQLPLGRITNEIFKQYNINPSNKEGEYDVYVPCGYNNVESELLKVKNADSKFIFGINGCDNIVSKNNLWQLLKNCYGRENAGHLMPLSFVLNDLKDMEYFKNKVYNKNTIYILKKNVQRKEGLKLTKDLKTILNAKFENYKVVQEYKTDLYLINKRKVNLRIYLLIVLKNGRKYFYIAKDGKCIYTYKEYNDNDLDFESNITSYHLDMNVYKNNPRNFEELKEYINNNGGNGDALFKKIDYILMKICKCLSNDKALYQSSNLNKSTTFQLFGIDVIFDKDLNPYLLEMNKGPDMIPRDDVDKVLKTKVQSHMFSIIGLLPEIQNNTFRLIYQK